MDLNILSHWAKSRFKLMQAPKLQNDHFKRMISQSRLSCLTSIDCHFISDVNRVSSSLMIVVDLGFVLISLNLRLSTAKDGPILCQNPSPNELLNLLVYLRSNQVPICSYLFIHCTRLIPLRSRRGILDEGYFIPEISDSANLSLSPHRIRPYYIPIYTSENLVRPCIEPLQRNANRFEVLTSHFELLYFVPKPVEDILTQTWWDAD